MPPDFVHIPDDRLLATAPVRSFDAFALRNNLFAAFQDPISPPDRPRLQYAAMGDWYSSLGAIGTYAFLGSTSTTATAAGSTKAGSSLRYAGIRSGNSFTGDTPAATEFAGNGGTPAGTWQCMGIDRSASSRYGATLWLRIS